jgi:hypothetical protein
MMIAEHAVKNKRSRCSDVPPVVAEFVDVFALDPDRVSQCAVS